MKRYLVLLLLIVAMLMCISCNDAPKKKPYVEIGNKGYFKNVYLQITKDGEPENEVCEPFEVGMRCYVYPSEGDGYTIRFYKTSDTMMELRDDRFIEIRNIEKTAEIHIEIDNYVTYVELSDSFAITITKSEEINQ